MGRPVESETPKPAFSKATPPKPTQNSTTNKRPSIQIAVPVGDIRVQTTPAFKNYTESDTLIAFQKFHFFLISKFQVPSSPDLTSRRPVHLPCTTTSPHLHPLWEPQVRKRIAESFLFHGDLSLQSLRGERIHALPVHKKAEHLKFRHIHLPPIH